MKQISGGYSLQCACHKAYWGVKICLYTFLISALGGRELSASRFLCFTSAKKRSNPAGLLSSGHYTDSVNRLTPNDPYMGRTAPLTTKRCILYIYSTNIGTEYFKHALYSPFFSLQNAVCFIMLTCLVHVLFTFYIQVC